MTDHVPGLVQAFNKKKGRGYGPKPSLLVKWCGDIDILYMCVNSQPLARWSPLLQRSSSKPVHVEVYSKQYYVI